MSGGRQVNFNLKKKSCNTTMCLFVMSAAFLFPFKLLHGGDIQSELGNIMIKNIDFSDASLRDIMKYLREKSNGRVGFILNTTEKENAALITLRLTDVTLGDIVKYTCMSAGVKYKITEQSVVIGGELAKFKGPLLPDKGAVPGSVICNKLNQIKLSSLDFEDASIESVIEYLRVSSQRSDSLKKGVNIVFAVKEEEKEKLPGMTLALNNISLWDAIKSACSAANLDCRIEQNAVVISSMEKNGKKRNEQ